MNDANVYLVIHTPFKSILIDFDIEYNSVTIDMIYNIRETLGSYNSWC